MSVIYFLLLFSSKGLWTATPDPIWIRITTLICSVIILYGFIKLLRWNKTGFYIIITGRFFSLLLTILVLATVGGQAILASVLYTIISVVILFAILQIRKDGTSFWNAMVNQIVRPQRSVHEAKYMYEPCQRTATDPCTIHHSLAERNKKSAIVDETLLAEFEYASMRKIRNRYGMIDKIGSGGYASVWKCIDFKINEYCAIKIYSESTLNREQATLIEIKHKQFSHFNHPNIVPVIDYFTENEYLHVVMPYYKRGTLSTQGNTLTEQSLWRVCLDIANGLMFLHENDVIHLDVKPGNILQGNTGEYLLSDFCISQAMKELTHKNDSAKTFGAASYMAPERFLGVVSTACDIWALGATLYELAIGEPPFAGLGGRNQIQTKDNLLPLSIGPRYSQQMNDLIMSCLRPNPQDRPSAKDLVILANDKSKFLSLKKNSESLHLIDFYGNYSAAALTRLENYIIDKDLLSGLYGIKDKSGRILVEHVYDTISPFFETTWPGPGPLPPRKYFFLGAGFRQGDYVGYLYIQEDGSITEYRRCTREQFSHLSQLT